MTYKEVYESYETPEEVIEEAKHDISIAIILNPDRLNPIKEALKEVLEEKFPEFKFENEK